jgi:hypothetical protein
VTNVGDDAATTRVSLSRGELLHLKSFAENVDCDPDDVAWWDRLTNKLERAIARIDGTVPRVHRTPILEAKPDLRRAHCRACGWEGQIPKTQPCPSCGQKVNPLLWGFTGVKA